MQSEVTAGGVSGRIPHLPGSRYAQELGRDSRDMRFAPELEREFLAFYMVERRTHVRSFNPIVFALLVLAWAASFASEPASFGTHLRLAIIAAAYAVMVWAAFSRHYERLYLKVAGYASLVVALFAAIEVGHQVARGAGEYFGLLTPYTIGLYFLAAILYRTALQANVIMVIAFATTLAYRGAAPGKVIELSSILAGMALIGGIAFRHQAIRFRRSFLERGLIAELAARDGLTGLKNRRAFDEYLTRTWQQALRDRRPLALMLIDVDHFKRFNDCYGHQAGDQALQRIGQVVDGFARRPLDVAARYGGEEFAVILFDVPREQAVQIAEQICEAIRKLAIPHAGEDPGVITISIGVAIVRPTLERSPEGAMQLADEGLYAAKHDGRNRVRALESEHQSLSTGNFRAL